MAVELGKGVISGVTTATSDTDIAYKEYADNKPGYALTTTINDGDFYKGSISAPGGTTAVAISSSFQYTCYTSSGCYNYPIDSSATNLSVYITSAGGGGEPGSGDFANVSHGFNWSSPTGYMPVSGWSYGCMDFADNGTRIAGIPLDQGYAVITSDDGGMNWSKRTLGSTYGTRGFIYDNNLWVSAGCYQNLMVSTDTINWARRTTACSGSVNFAGIAYGNGVWFAPGCNCTSQSSTDTVHWTMRTLACAFSNAFWRNVVFGDGKFLVSTYYGALQTSTDAVHWTLRTLGHTWYCTNSTRYLDGEFLITDYNTGGAHAAKSTDAIHWEGSGNLAEVRGGCGSWDITKINNGRQYLVTGGGGARVSTSTDFLHWNICCVQDCGAYGGCSGDCDFNYCWWTVYRANLTDYPERYFMSGYGYNQMAISDMKPSGSSGGGGSAGQAFLYNLSLENVSKKEGLRVCVGSGGKGGGWVWDASNYLTVWKARTALPTGCKIYDMEFNDGKFVGVGQGRLVTVSTDSIVWSLRTVGEVSSACDYRSVIYDGVNWLVTGQTNAGNGSSGSLSVSSDTIHWSQRTTGIPDDHRQIMYHDGNKKYFMNSNGCSAASSTDAIHWTLRTIGLDMYNASNYCGSLSCSQDYYLYSSAADTKQLSASTDLIHWSRRTIGHGNKFVMAHGYIHPNYVAYMWCSAVSTSTDTINWTIRTGVNYMCNNVGNPSHNLLRNLNNELFFSNDQKGNRGASSTDGIHWVCRYQPFSGMSSSYRTISYGKGHYVISASGSSNTCFCLNAFDASTQQGGTTSVRWNEGLPANAKGSVYPLEIATTGGTPPTAASASYCFDPVGSEAAVLDYNSSVFRLSDSDTTAVGDFTVEFWYRLKLDGSNPALSTLFALGESTENGFLSVKHSSGNLCYYYKDTAGALQSRSLATSACNTWYHVALEYSDSTGCFSHFLDGTRIGQYNATSNKPVVYGDRLRIGSLYNPECSLTSLIDQGAFNGEITNFRISNNQRYNSSSYTVPTPDFTPDANTVFLTGRGESLNGTLSCQCLVGPTISGGPRGTLSGSDAPNFDADNPIWMYDLHLTGSNNRSFITPIESGSNCEYRKGLPGSSIEGSVPSGYNCGCAAYSTSTGGGGGAFSAGNTVNGSKAYAINLFNNSTCFECGTSMPDIGGMGIGGRGASMLVKPRPGDFTRQQVNTSAGNCEFFGMGYLNGYYFGSNQASTDAIHWVVRTVWPQASVPSYAGTGFIAQTDSEAILWTCQCFLYHTTDTINWTLRTVGFAGNCHVRSVRYLNSNEWAMTGCCNLTTLSTDTIHWIFRTTAGCSNTIINGMVYGNGIYMAAGHCCHYIATSTDSFHWTKRTRSTSMNSDSTPYTPAFGNGMFIVSAYQGYGYSTDAINWAATGSTICGHYKFTPCFNKCVNSFIAVDYYLNIDMSDDGITWSQPGRLASASSSQGRSVNVVGPSSGNSKMLWAHNDNAGLGRLHVADMNNGFLNGSKGSRGSGGGGGGFYSPIRNSTKGGDGGDGYVRINWK